MPSLGKLTQVEARACRRIRLGQHVPHLETATTARTPMNRQVGPSIILSVLIVCFFAVALFQRDPPRSARARSGLGETEKSPRTASVIEDIQRKGSTATDEPRQPRRAADARRLNAGPGAAPNARVLPASARTQGKEAAPIVTAGLKVAAPVNLRREPASPIVTAGLKAAAPVDLRREPASAFIVVQANETIRDVALRVYGSSERAAALWRANRDALPVLDSPLSSGMVLRTPIIR
jgi:hypothetical protein